MRPSLVCIPSRVIALGLLLAQGCFAAGCTGSSRPVRASVPASSSGTAIPPPSANAVARVPCAHRSAPDSASPGAAWQVPLENSVGGSFLAAEDGLLVAWQPAGKSVSIDLESGSVCAVLAQPPGAAPGSAIDPNTEHVGISHGALVGPRRFGIAAVELGSGTVRWTRAPLAPGNADEFALSAGLEIASTATATVVGFRARFRDADSFRWDELVAALDPRTGADLWRQTVVSHARGEPIFQEGTIRIATDGEHVFVRSDGKLQALDAAGKEAWSQTWPALGKVVGPPSVATRGPLLVAGNGRVALAFPGRIELFDARTGTKLRAVALPGAVPTELVLRAGRVVAALEGTPGTASLVAIDAHSARTLWTAPVPYAVRRLRVDAERAYALDGNGRIWARDVLTGAVRFGLDPSGFEFEVARTSAGTPRIVTLRGGVTALDPAPGAMPAPLEPFAFWEFEAKPGPDGDDCYPRSLTWLDGEDRVLWRRELPARIRKFNFGTCAESEISEYRRSPRRNARLLGVVFGGLELDEILVAPDPSGLLVLRKADGKIVLDFAAPAVGSAFYFDEGAFELVGVPDCKGPSAGAQVFARCGERVVYFNGSTAAVLKLNPPRLEARGVFRTELHETQGRPSEAHAAIPLGRMTLRLNGTVFMR